MCKFMRKITAVSAAVVMAVSALGTTVSAEFEQEDTVGWVMTADGWIYVMEDGKPAIGRLMEIDGIMYKFDDKWSYHYEKYSGWVRLSAGRRRRYVHGLPYTGWLKYKNDKSRYCLDGYVVTGKLQMDDYIYSFDEDGYFTGKTASMLMTVCDGRISGDAEEIMVTLKNLDGRDYNFGVLSKMERWEKGKWVNCWGDWKDANEKPLAFSDAVYSLGDKGDTKELSFNPQLYTNYEFTEGYYRIPVASTVASKKYDCYAMFQVVPPVDVKMSEKLYFDSRNMVQVNFTANITSDKLDKSGKDIEAHIYKMTGEGWQDITEYTDADGKILTEAVPQDKAENGSISYGMIVESGMGYYKAVIKADGVEYADYFRIESLGAFPWIEKYSTKTDRLVVNFRISNNTNHTVFFNNDAHTLYHKEKGRWVEVTEGRKAVEESSETIEARRKTLYLEPNYNTNVSVNISDYYVVSELEEGMYAVYLSGLGYQTFWLYNEELPAEIYPYKDIREDDIESIVLEVSDGGGSEFLTVDKRDMEYVLDCLRQFYVGAEYKYSSNDIPAGGGFRVKITFKDGREDLFGFIEGNVIIKKGKYYLCGEYLYGTFNDLIIERLDLDKKYYGYGNTY